jgi:hypothetical protein
MPGDDEIKDPTYLTTRAVTINASSEKIWPWLPWIEKGRPKSSSYYLAYFNTSP